jgi:hypothetical protein
MWNVKYKIVIKCAVLCCYFVVMTRFFAICQGLSVFYFMMFYISLLLSLLFLSFQFSFV